METVKSISSKYLKVNDDDYFKIILGISLFLLLSLIRGFIPVTIGYILTLPGVTNESATLFFIIPMISLFILPYVKTQYQIFPQGLLVSWFLAVAVTNLLIKFILILIGLYFVFSILLFLMTIESAKINPIESIVIMVLLDLSLKSVNRGNDPISAYGFISLFVVLIFVIVAILFVRTNLDELNTTPIEPISDRALNNRIHDSSIFAFFMGLLIYFSFFANPGIMILSLEMANQSSITVFIIIVSSISYLGYRFYPKIVEDPRLFSIAPVTLLISVALTPWIGFIFIFYVVGLLSLVIMLSYNISKVPKDLSLQTSGLYFVSLISFLVFLFLIISEDGMLIPLIFTILCGSFTAVSYYYSKVSEGER